MQLPHMFLQVEIPAKALAANFTGERFFVVMRVHVKSEIIDLMERLVADVALICLFSAVRQFMIFVVALLMKSFTAELADKRLKIGVYSRMSVQG